MTATPTEELYRTLQSAFEHFNADLFEGELPNVIFTMQRKQKCMGYLAPNRWASFGDKRYCHELAINPAYIGTASTISLFQTIVHECVHVWSYLKPETRKPGRNGYHSKQWSQKMEEIGLMPSSTGKPGGKKTGQIMSDYPIKGGLFILSCKSLIKTQQFKIPWIDRWAEPVNEYEGLPDFLEYINTDEPSDQALDEAKEDAEVISILMAPVSSFFESVGNDLLIPSSARDVPTKTKYRCRSCLTNIWGKPNLKVRCEACNVLFLVVN